MLSVLGACVTRGPLIPPSLAAESPRGVELDATPFFPQSRYQCGPAALATILDASGAHVSPDALVPLVYLPARHGSLQVEMQAAPREYARLSYRLAPNLDAILAELNAGRPVLVLHNYGLPFLPRWHYAVVVGYDAASDAVALRSGVTRRQLLSARNFMRAWDNGGRWAMVVLRPGELPANASAATYLESAAAFERVASPADANQAFSAAVKRWPEQPVAWIGRGTAEYRSGDLQSAVDDYRAALAIDPSNIGARNNLAMTLLDLGCSERAREQLGKIDIESVPSALHAAVLDTRQRVAASSQRLDDPAVCRATEH